MILATLLVACSSPPPPPPPSAQRPVALVYSHDLDGEIEPCG